MTWQESWGSLGVRVVCDGCGRHGPVAPAGSVLWGPGWVRAAEFWPSPLGLGDLCPTCVLARRLAALPVAVRVAVVVAICTAVAGVALIGGCW